MSDPFGGVDVLSRCERLQYPVLRADAAAAFADVTVETGDEETNLGVVISECDHDSFANPDELHDELASSVEESH
jgi:hypothetical protein